MRIGHHAARRQSLRQHSQRLLYFGRIKAAIMHRDEAQPQCLGFALHFVRMDRIAHTSQKVGLASAMAIVLLIIILICALLQQLFFNYAFKDADDGVEKAKKKAAKIERQRARMAKKNAPIFKNGPSKTEKAVA